MQNKTMNLQVYANLYKNPISLHAMHDKLGRRFEHLNLIKRRTAQLSLICILIQFFIASNQNHFFVLKKSSKRKKFNYRPFPL